MTVVFRISLKKGDITLLPSKKDFRLYAGYFRCPNCGYEFEGCCINRSLNTFTCPKCNTTYEVKEIDAFLVAEVKE